MVFGYSGEARLKRIGLENEATKMDSLALVGNVREPFILGGGIPDALETRFIVKLQVMFVPSVLSTRHILEELFSVIECVSVYMITDQIGWSLHNPSRHH